MFLIGDALKQYEFSEQGSRLSFPVIASAQACVSNSIHLLVSQ
jgi:hypothetical protein